MLWHWLRSRSTYRIGESARKTVSSVDEFVGLFLQVRQVALAAAVLDDELEAARRAEAGHGRRPQDGHDCFRDLGVDSLPQGGRYGVAI
jgi:hypothetical protein